MLLFLRQKSWRQFLARVLMVVFLFTQAFPSTFSFFRGDQEVQAESIILNSTDRQRDYRMPLPPLAGEYHPIVFHWWVKAASQTSYDNLRFSADLSALFANNKINGVIGVSSVIVSSDDNWTNQVANNLQAQNMGYYNASTHKVTWPALDHLSAAQYAHVYLSVNLDPRTQDTEQLSQNATAMYDFLSERDKVITLKTHTHTIHAPKFNISKTDNRETINAGEINTYTITAKNIGTGNAYNVFIRDNVPSYIKVTDTGGAVHTSADAEGYGGVLTWGGNGQRFSGSYSPLQNSWPSTQTFSYSGIVNPNTPDQTVLTNTVTISAKNDENITGTKIAQDITTVINQPPPQQGTLQIRVYKDNNRNGVLDSGEIVPNNLFEGDVTVNVNGGIGSFVVSGGQDDRVVNAGTYTATSLSNATLNYATLSASCSGCKPTANVLSGGADTINIAVQPPPVSAPGLSIVKTVKEGANLLCTTQGQNSISVTVGSRVTYCFEVKNTGNTTLSSIEVNDDRLGVIGTIDSLAPDAQQTLSKTHTAVQGEVTNRATATSGNLTASDTAKVTGTAAPAPALNIQKYVSDTTTTFNTQNITVNPGADAYYRVVVWNSGNAGITTDLSDNLNNPAIFVSAPVFPNAASSLTFGSVPNPTTPQLANAAFKQGVNAISRDGITYGYYIDYKGTVGSCSVVHDKASKEATNTASVLDASSQAKVAVNANDCKTQLEIKKFVRSIDNNIAGPWLESVSVSPGKTVQYAILVANRGNIKAENVVVEDRFTENPSFISSNDNKSPITLSLKGSQEEGGICTIPDNPTNGFGTGECFRWLWMGEMPDVNNLQRYTTKDTHDKAEIIQITNTAEVRMGGIVVGRAEAKVLVSYAGNFDLGKHCTFTRDGQTDNCHENEVFPGETLTYTLTATNKGSATAPVIISDNVQNLLAFATIHSNTLPTDCKLNTSQITCETRSVAAGEITSVSFSATIKPFERWTTPQNYNYQIRNSFGNAVVVDVVDFQIEKTAEASTIEPPSSTGYKDSIAKWHITVTNHSGRAREVSLRDLLPADFFYVPDSTVGGITNNPAINTSETRLGWNNVSVPGKGGEARFSFETYNNDPSYFGSKKNEIEVLYKGKNFDQDTATVTITKPVITLQGYVWEDANSNGWIGQSPSEEKGIHGMTITLKDSSNNVLGTQQSQSNGYYQFTGTNLTAGEKYTLTITPSALYNNVSLNIGGQVDASEGQKCTDTAFAGRVRCIGHNQFVINQTIKADGTQYFNFGLGRKQGGLMVYLYEIGEGGSRTPFDFAKGDVSIGINGKVGEQVVHAIYPYNNDNNKVFNDIPTATYFADMINFPIGWRDVTLSTLGCNDTIAIDPGAMGVINLCLKGNAEIVAEKYVRASGSQEWVKFLDLGKIQQNTKLEYLIVVRNLQTAPQTVNINDKVISGRRFLQATLYEQSWKNVTISANATATQPAVQDIECDKVGANYVTYCYTQTLSGSIEIDGYTHALEQQLTNQVKVFSRQSNGDDHQELNRATTITQFSYGPEFDGSKSYTIARNGSVYTQGPAMPGDEITYVLRARNVGNATGSMAFADDLSGIASFVEINTLSEATLGQDFLLDWGTVTLAPSQTVEKTFSVTVRDFNQWPKNQQPTLVNKFFDEVKIDLNYHDLTIDKQASASHVKRGSDVVYTIRISNDGNADLIDLVLSDAIPEGMALKAAHALYLETGSVVQVVNPDTTTIPGEVRYEFDLPAGASGKVTLIMTVEDNAANTAGKQLVNTATLGGISDSATITVTESKIAISKLVKNTKGESGSRLEITPGETASFEITVKNTGTATETVSLKDSMDFALFDQVTLIEGSNATNITQSSWIDHPLAQNRQLGPGGQITLTIRVVAKQVMPVSGSNTVTNVAVVEYGTHSESANAVLEIVAAENLIVTKDDSRTVVNAGEPTTYTITIENQGNATAKGVYLLDTLPTNMQAGSLQVSDLTIEVGGNQTAVYGAYTNIPGTVRWPDENATFLMPPGAKGTATVTLIPVVATGTVNPLEVKNEATLFSDSSSLEATDINLIQYAPTLKISKQVSADNANWGSAVTVNEGDNVYFRIIVNNDGNAPADNFGISDTLASNFEVLGASPFCSIDGNTINCASLTLGAGQQTVVELLVKAIKPTVGNGSVQNIGNLTHNNTVIPSDPVTIKIEALQPAKLQVEKYVRKLGSSSDAWAKGIDASPGEKVEYAYVFSNTGEKAINLADTTMVTVADSFVYGADNIAGTPGVQLAGTLSGNPDCIVNSPTSFTDNCAAVFYGTGSHEILTPQTQQAGQVRITNQITVNYDSRFVSSIATVDVQYQQISLQGYVWLDNNQNRLMESSEIIGYDGGRVSVHRQGAQIALTTVTTSNNGYYIINHPSVVAGLDYSLQFTNPSGILYTLTGLNQGGVLGENEGNACSGEQCAGNDTFALKELSANDASNYHNFGLRRKTGDLSVNIWEVTLDNATIPFDQNSKGLVQVSVVGEDFSNSYQNSSNKSYTPIPTGNYTASIISRPSGWSIVESGQCNKTANVAENQEGVINLCLQGNASVSISKFVRAAGETTWYNHKMLGVVDTTNPPNLEYLVIVSNIGSTETTVDISDTITRGQNYLTGSAANRIHDNITISAGQVRPDHNDIVCDAQQGQMVSNGNYYAFCYQEDVRSSYTSSVDSGYIVNTAKLYQSGKEALSDADSASAVLSYLGNLTGTKNATITQHNGASVAYPEITTALSGERVRYLLTLSNTGSAPINYHFVDDLSKVLPLVEYISLSGGIAPTGNHADWGVVTLAAGETITASIEGVITLSKNWPVGIPARLDNSFFGDRILIDLEDPMVDLVVTKTDHKHEVKAGEETTYTITIKNQGNATAEDVYLVDTLPVNAEFVSSTDLVLTTANNSQAFSAQKIGNELRWPDSNTTFALPKGASATATVTLRAKMDTTLTNPLQLVNQVEAFSADFPREVDPASRTAVDINTITVPDIQITKGVGYTRNGSFGPSATISTGYDAWYRIVISNNGSASETVTVTDRMNFDRFSAVFFNDIPVQGSGDTEFTLAEDITLAPDEVRTFKVRVVAGGTAGTAGVETVVNTAEVTFGEMSKTAQAALNIHAEADIVLEKRAWNITPGRESDPTVVPVQPGDWIEYTLTARNVGSAPTPAFTFVDNLSDVLDDVNLPWVADENLQFPQGGMLLNNITSPSGSDSPISSPIFPGLGDYAGGPGVVYESTQSIAPKQTLSYKFRVRVGDLDRGNNILRNVYGNPVVIHVNEPALHITKTVDYGHRYPGEMVWFTLVVENRGNVTANNIEVIDYLPHSPGNPFFKYAGETRGATNRHPSGPGGSALIPNETIELHWKTNTHGQPFSLAPGQKLQLSYKALVDVLPPDFVAAAYINEAEAHFDGGISNRAQVQVLVHPFPASPLFIDKTFDGLSSKYRQVNGGERTNFVVRVHNTSNTDNINGIYVSDLLPEGFTIEKDIFGQIVKATVSIRDAAGNVYNNTNPLAPCRFGSCQLTPNYVPGDGKFVWPAGSTGFTVPKGGTLTINFNESLRAPMVNTLTPFVNQATLLRDGDPIGSDSVFGVILPPPAPDVRIDKQVKAGQRNSGSAYQQSLTIDNIIPESTWVTYRITAFNTGTLGQTVRLTDTVDFASANSIYDELRVYKAGENTPVATYNANTHGNLTSITLADQLNVTAGSSLDNSCQGCRYFIEARMRSAFSEGDESHRNIASAINVSNDSVIAEDDATVKVDVRGALEIAKKVRNFSQIPGGNFGSQTTAQPGDIVEYRIDLQNTGVVSLKNVTVKDQLDLGPQGFPYHSNIHMFNANADNNTRSFTGSWDEATISEVAPGTTESYIIRAVIASPFVSPSGTKIHNVACVGDNCTPPTTVVVDTVGRPNIAKLVSKDGVNFSQTLTAEPGATLTYKVMVWNSGDGLIPSLTVTDTLETQDYASYGNSLNRDADNNSNLYSGTSYESLTISVPGNTSMTTAEVFTFTATLKGSSHFTHGDVTTNTASFTYNGQQYEASTRVTINVPAPKLVLSKSAENLTQGGNAESKTAKPGDEIRYTLQVRNTGNAPSGVVSFEDDINDVLEYANVTDTAGGTVSGGVISWPGISSIASGATETRTFTVKIKDPLPTTGDFVMMNFFGNEVQVPVGDLKLSKKATFEDGTTVNRAVRSSETVHYCIAATNLGSQSISNYVFQDGVESIAEYAHNFRKINPNDPDFQQLDMNNDGVTDLLRWDATTLGAGATVSRCFAVTVKPVQQWPDDGDYRMDNIYGDRVTIDVFHAGIQVNKDLVTDPVTAIGQNVRFRMTVTNNGQVPLFSFRMEDLYDTAKLDFVSVSGITTPSTVTENAGSQSSRVVNGMTINPAGQLSWDWNRITSNLPNTADDPRTAANDAIPSLNPGQSITFFADFVATAVGQAHNELYVWADDFLPYSIVEAGDDAKVEVRGADVSLSKTVNRAQVDGSASTAARTVTYTLTLRNQSNQAAHNLRLEDLLPSGFSYTGTATLDGVANAPAQNTVGNQTQLNWSGISLGANQTAVVSYQAVAVSQAGNYINLAVLKDADGKTLDTAQATVTVTVPDQENPLRIDKSVDRTTLKVGEEVVYTVKITNTGDTNLTGMSLSDALPAGFVYQGGATLGGQVNEPTYSASANPQVLNWTGLSLNAGQSATVVYRVKAAMTAGVYTNLATVQVGNFSASDAVNVHVVVPQVLGVKSGPTKAQPFVSVLASTGSDLSIVFGTLFLVLMSFGGYQLLTRRRTSFL